MELKGNLLPSILQEQSTYSQRTWLDRKRYFTATAHRAEKVDSKERLGGILAGFSQIYKEFNFPIIFPAHSRTVKNDRRIRLQSA
jgi:UDP-N-acetylglucosamine 2-epimerase